MIKRLLTSAFLLLVTITFAQVSTQEKDVLVEFYTSTNGAKWNISWDLDEPVEKWQGITVEKNSVTEISLLFNNISGDIPASLGTLKNLKVLELSFNPITGKIPTELANLEKLENLSLNSTLLSGTIPNELGKLKNLKQLHLSSNKLVGEIPNELGRLKKLEVFNVFDNNLTGIVPGDLASNRNLKELMIAENNFKSIGSVSAIGLSNSGVALDLNERNSQTEFNRTIIANEVNDSDE